MWSTFVDGLGWLLGILAHGMNGSQGLAIIVMAVAMRLILLPLSLPLAEQAWHRQRAMLALKPALDALRSQHADNPMAYAQASQALYREHGLNQGLGRNLWLALCQAPMGAGLYAAIQRGVTGSGSFLWINQLARPDHWLALGVALLSAFAVMLHPAMPEQARHLLQWLPVLVALLMVWHLSAGLGLYWLGTSSVSIVQTVLLRRRIRRNQMAAGCI